jgi:serine/threonine-protein kinase
MTQLMFKIANEPPADILSLNPALPECLVEVINRALAKDVTQRYKTGDEMAKAIRDCMAQAGTVDVAL